MVTPCPRVQGHADLTFRSGPRREPELGIAVLQVPLHREIGIARLGRVAPMQTDLTPSHWMADLDPRHPCQPLRLLSRSQGIGGLKDKQVRRDRKVELEGAPG